MSKIKEMFNYMCNSCGGGFSKEEMQFNTEYDCDLCSGCHSRTDKRRSK